MRDLINLMESALNEAPLADFETFGDLDAEGSFRKDDLKAVRSEKWLTKVNAQFKNFPFPLNVYVYNGEGGMVKVRGKNVAARELEQTLRHAGLVSPADAQSLIGKVPPDFATSINAILIENEGAERVPLTPWILGHRICHALLIPAEAAADNPNRIPDPKVQQAGEALFRLYNHFLRGIESGLSKDPEFDRRVKDTPDGRLYDITVHNMIAQRIGTMRSARTGKLANTGEFLVELMVQVMIQGKVKLQRPDLPGGERHAPYDGPNAALFAKAVETYRKTRYFDGHDFAKEVIKPMNRPAMKPWFLVIDAEGNGLGSTSRQESAEQMAAKTPGARIEVKQPNKSAITRYNNYLTKFDQTAAQYDAWKEEGLLAHHGTPTEQMLLDERLASYERSLTSTINAFFEQCVGRIALL